MNSDIRSAVADFQQSRRRAQIEAMLNRLSGRSNELLSYEDVRTRLRLGTSVMKGVENVPIQSIIGSVGRYQDFTRNFLPRHDSDQDRWARVKTGVADLSGLPPVELYQIGDAYFVIDGHHRISVAKQVGATHIEAYVRELPSRVKLSPDVDPEDLILKYEYADFLYETGFDKYFPDIELRLTEAGLFPVLKEHIDVHRYYMGVEQEREIPMEEAVRDWFEYFYQPVVEAIHKLGVLRDFPDRTDTDLYLWSVNYRAALENELGWSVTTAAAVSDLASRKSPTPGRIVKRLGRWLYDVLLPDVIESGPKPGEWRQVLVHGEQPSLFPSILVPLSERDQDWQALEQAIMIAGREEGTVHGLYVRPEKGDGGEIEDRLRAGFTDRIQQTGVRGQFVVQEGQIARTICDRARWDNLVVLYTKYPPADTPMDRLGSGLRMLIHRCPRPVLVIPEKAKPMDHVLLAYNDSAKAQEALFVAAHIAGAWGSKLTVLSAAEKGLLGYEWLDQARSYLEDHGVEAEYHHKFGSVSRVVDHAASQYKCDMILMGGYKAGPIKEVMLGSKVDELMRRSDIPLLVCS